VQSQQTRKCFITYEEIGFSKIFSRVLDRFLKQVFSDVENLVIQEYRFYRYLFLTTLKCLILFIVPFLVNFSQKNIFSPTFNRILEYSTNRNFLKLISTKNVLLQN
jgi:hypothetical protein